MNADHQWLSDADPLWELTTSDGDYAALASEGPPPYDEDGDEDLSLRIVLRGDVALTLQTGAGGTAVEAVSELEFTGRELEDLYLALQRHFGHNEDRRILDRRQREQDEHQRVQEENRQRWEWEAWVDRHPWVIVAKNQQRGPNFTGYHGTIHARWCRYAPVTTYPNRDGYTTAEVTSGSSSSAGSAVESRRLTAPTKGVVVDLFSVPVQRETDPPGVSVDLCVLGVLRVLVVLRYQHVVSRAFR